MQNMNVTRIVISHGCIAQPCSRRLAPPGTSIIFILHDLPSLLFYHIHRLDMHLMHVCDMYMQLLCVFSLYSSSF